VKVTRFELIHRRSRGAEQYKARISSHGGAGWGRMGAIAPDARLASIIRDRFKGTLILNGGYDFFLANPDIPLRFMKNAHLNSTDVSTFYMGEDKGYIDYPKLEIHTSSVT